MRTIWKLSWAVLVVVVSLGLSLAAHANTVGWNAQGAALTDANGSLTASGNLIILGTFSGLTDNEIIAGLDQPATLMASANWMPLQTSQVGFFEGSGQTGFNGIFGVQFSGNFETTFAAFAGNPIFVWTFNAPTVDAATQEGVFKFAVNFPADEATASPTIDLVDLFTAPVNDRPRILWGGLGVGNVTTELGEGAHIDMALIPEPSTFVLVLGSLLLAANLRPRSAR